MEQVKWSEFQAVSVVSFHSSVSSSQLLKQIVENAADIKTFRFEGQQSLSLDLGGSDFKIPELRGQRAEIENKYYKARVHFIELDKSIPLDSIPHEHLHGSVIYFDTNDRESFEFAESYAVESNIFLDDSAVKLFVCDTAKDSDVIPKIDILKFCIDNGFEMVELRPEIEEEDEDDLEDDFKETLSFPRIYQSLEAYIWPNIEYIESCTQSKLHDNALMDEMKRLNMNGCSGSGDEAANEHKIDEFEELLTKFNDIKGKAEAMSGEDRKKYAEKVALSFFNSICDNDEEESSVVSSDDENNSKEGYSQM